MQSRCDGRRRLAARQRSKIEGGGFFFSSRRRHTRSTRDWSSDVCSSDLEFLRPLFPDYPRRAVWRDGYYIPTSTGDDVIQKHACVAERDKMLKGLPATEQCVIIDGVNFLNNTYLDGLARPPRGAPNIMMAAGGTQLKKILQDDSVYAWSFHADWQNPA